MAATRWSRRRATGAPTVDAVGVELARRPAALLAVAGASNVTGEVLPLREFPAVAHRHGAWIAVDEAQLVPHRRVDVAGFGWRAPRDLIGAVAVAAAPHVIEALRDRVAEAHEAALLARFTASGGTAAVRASLELGCSSHDVDRLIEALHRLRADGPSWPYTEPTGGCAPNPDPRELPAWTEATT